MSAILKVSGLTVHYGGIVALRDFSLQIEEGEIVTLIGANGAGKTTTMNSIMGIVPKKSGTVEFLGQDITKTETREIVKKGMILAPEGRQIFPDFTVLENLLLGGFFFDENTNRKKMEKVFALFPILKERQGQLGGTLSGGEQQMLAIGRALMANPKLLMLDEPSLGLAPLIINDIFKLIREIREMGVSILLVEQNAKMALKISDRGYVIESGILKLQDNASNLLHSEAVIRAYLS